MFFTSNHHPLLYAVGIAERKDRERKELRHRILDAAMKLFIAHGIEEVSIRKIADLIEYSPTTIYLYFKDKNEIFYDLRSEGFRLLLELNSTYQKHAQDSLERLRWYGKAYIDFALQNRQYYKLMFILMAPMRTEAAEIDKDPFDYAKQSWELLVASVQDCIADGYFHYDDPHVGAYYWHSLVHGLVSLHIQECVSCPEEVLMYWIEAAFQKTIEEIKNK